MPKSTNTLRGYFYIAASTFFWGISATMGRAAFTGQLLFHGHTIGSIDPVILSQSRTTLSFLLLLLFMLAGRRLKEVSFSKSEFWRMGLLGVFGLAGSNFFYYLAIEKMNVATAITVQYTAPIWVLLYLAMRGVQKPTSQKTIAVMLAFVGIAIAIGGFHAGTTHLNVTGVIAALLAAFSFAFYNIGGHDILSRLDHWVVMLFMTLAASLFWILINPPWKVIAAHYSIAQWSFLAVFSLTSMLIPFSFYFAGLRYLEPTRAIVTSCLEPVFSIVIAAVVLGEKVWFVQLVGMVMVLVAIVMVQLPVTPEGPGARNLG